MVRHRGKFGDLRFKASISKEEVNELSDMLEYKNREDGF
tara:strand:+ start:2274 stop:2390 length:117 start_codon:yes stop_codon:yes gene_type:complete